MQDLNKTPSANRLHIGFFGKRNSGKSSLINAFAGQEVSIVSPVLGTTTDLVYKAMEIAPLGPCMLMDTAGFDDVGELGKLRIEKTKLAMEKADIAVVLFWGEDINDEILLVKNFKKAKTPVLCVISKADVISNSKELQKQVKEQTNLESIIVSSNDKKSMEIFKEELIKIVPDDFDMISLTGEFVSEDDIVLLVMPQDIQAPKGRLILPQVQTIRDLLENKCTVICTTTDKLKTALSKLKNPPNLIVTDSQVFKTVYEQKPKESRLTSFSVLFANYKGDLNYFANSAYAIEKLTENSNVLIAEVCSHAPLEEDIGRVKIPALLRKKVGEKLNIDFVRGTDFPKDINKYDLIIECGGCMFGRKYLMTRVDKAKTQNIPMSNYGVVIAYLSGILDKIDIKFNK